MAKGGRGRRRMSSRKLRPSPYILTSCGHRISKNMCVKNCCKDIAKKDFDDITCSVCMECPHNAVLLLCSSHDKGCRPYMCGTSFRYSNCLDQYKNAYTKVIPSNQTHTVIDASDTTWPAAKCEAMELACPLCRGQVKGWTVVEPAREYLNAKKRTCMQEDCSFDGTFKELRKHMKAKHPSARPREVDPDLEQKWRRLERERERDDVISTIRSSMPGATVLGDYVIEGDEDSDDDEDENENENENDEDSGNTNAAGRNRGYDEVGIDTNLVNVFLLLHAFGPSGNDHLNTRLRQSNENTISIHHPSDQEVDSDDSDYEDTIGDGGMSITNHFPDHRRDLLRQPARRRRRREASTT